MSVSSIESKSENDSSEKKYSIADKFFNKMAPLSGKMTLQERVDTAAGVIGGIEGGGLGAIEGEELGAKTAGIISKATQNAGNNQQKKQEQKDNEKNRKEDKELAEREKNKETSEENLEKKKEAHDDKDMNKLREGLHPFHAMSEHGLGLFVLLAIAAHIIDMAWFSRPQANVIVLFIYGLMIIIIGITSKGKLISIIELFVAMIIAYFVPWASQLFVNTPWQYTALGIVLLAPILPIYLTLKMPTESRWRKFVVGYIIFWCCIALIWALANFAQTSTSKVLMTNPLKILGYVATGTEKILSSGASAVSKTFAMAVAQATGQKYDGQEENQRGIFLENLRPIETQLYTDSNVIIEARIRAQNVPGTIPIKNICIIPGLEQGNTTPSSVSLGNNDENIIDCELGKIGKEGSYEVKFISTFTYETDADITYTFMNKNTYRLLDTDNTGNINTKLGITDMALATYTGGPVELGLPSLHQPLKIDPQNPNDIQYPFGVSLTNMWPRGTIIRGLQYTLEVPESVQLEKCTRAIASQSTKDGMNVYIFKINDANAREVFDSVTCRIKIVDLPALLGTGVKSEKTFSAKAVYEYSVEESVYIMIQQWMGDIQYASTKQTGGYP